MFRKMILAFCLLIISGCTSDSDIEKLALADAKKKYEIQMRDEIDKAIHGKDKLRESALTVLRDQAKFEIEKQSREGERAFVVVKVLAPPPAVRAKLFGVIEHLRDWTITGFNTSDALSLVRSEMGVQENTEIIYPIELKKGKTWQIVQ